MRHFCDISNLGKLKLCHGLPIRICALIFAHLYLLEMPTAVEMDFFYCVNKYLIFLKETQNEFPILRCIAFQLWTPTYFFQNFYWKAQVMGISKWYVAKTNLSNYFSSFNSAGICEYTSTFTYPINITRHFKISHL